MLTCTFNFMLRKIYFSNNRLFRNSLTRYFCLQHIQIAICIFTKIYSIKALIIYMYSYIASDIFCRQMFTIMCNTTLLFANSLCPSAINSNKVSKFIYRDNRYRFNPVWFFARLLLPQPTLVMTNAQTTIFTSGCIEKWHERRLLRE